MWFDYPACHKDYKADIIEIMQYLYLNTNRIGRLILRLRSKKVANLAQASKS